MFRMFKKTVLFAGGLTLVGFLIFGGSVFSHVKQGLGWVQNQVRDNVPVEYELQRARQLLQASDGQIRDCKRVVAEKQVEIRYLESDVEKLDTKRNDARAKLEQQKKFLDKDQPVYRVRGRRMSRNLVEHDARRRLSRVKAWDKMLVAKRARLDALEKNLHYAQETLEKVISQRAHLESTVDMLETKLRQTEAMKAASLNIDFDDSKLAQAANIIKDCGQRLDVMQQMIENDRPAWDTDVVPEEFGDVTADISNYLGDDGGTHEGTDL